tara:strand:+ start:271 stop:1566 length:1296 start_codon:yes stop_codon:yes gene_type:complete
MSQEDKYQKLLKRFQQQPETTPEEVESLNVDPSGSQLIPADYDQNNIPSAKTGDFDEVVAEATAGQVYDPETDSYVTPCECPAPFDEPDPNPDNQDAFDTMMGQWTLLGEALIKVTKAQEQIAETISVNAKLIQQNLATANKTKDAFMKEKSNLKRKHNQEFRVCEALKTLEALLEQRSRLANAMKTLAERNLQRMSQFGISLSPPTGGVGSPTLENAKRCLRSNSKAPGCGWFDSDYANQNLSEFNAMYRDYQAWDKYRKQVLNLNKKISKAYRTYSAAHAVLTGMENATIEVADGLWNGYNSDWGYYSESVVTANTALTNSFEIYISAVRSYNSIAAGISVVENKTYGQVSEEITCDDGTTKTCPINWAVTNIAKTDPAPAQMQIGSIDPFETTSKSDLERDYGLGCGNARGGLIAIPNPPDIGVGGIA